MADEPNGTNGPGSQPPPPPPADPPPPPLAEAPPPAPAAPPPAPAAAPAKPFLSPLVVVVLVVALLTGVVAILYFGGVFERLSGRQSEQTTAPTAYPPASGTSPPEAYPGLEGNMYATPDTPPPDGLTCNEVYSERDARALPEDGTRQTNRIDISRAGEIRWNGAAIDPVRLRQYLDLVRTMSPQPRTVVSVEAGAPATARGQVGVAISRAMNCDYMPN